VRLGARPIGRAFLSSLSAVHQTTIQVRWGELDPYNHVNHAVYSSYLEHARVVMLDDLDRGMETLAEAGYQIVVVRSDVRFRASATAGDELVISTRIGALRAATMIWCQTIDRNDQRIVDAEIHAACLSSNGRPVRIPETLREALEELA